MTQPVLFPPEPSVPEQDGAPGILAEQSRALHEKYQGILEVNPELTRQLVSFQANKEQPVYRWFKYKEAFSAHLVRYLLDKTNVQAGRLLDPFSGVGTAVFAAAEAGLDGLGIELLPVGRRVMEVRRALSHGAGPAVRERLAFWLREKPWLQEQEKLDIPHLRITKGAYPKETEALLGRYLKRVEREEEQQVRATLHFAALCILESISYTRKDGQYLRWDHRSGRRAGKSDFDKGRIWSFEEAITAKLAEIVFDLNGSADLFAAPVGSEVQGSIELINGSLLDVLPQMESASFDCLVTSPPYCNRYDYTRTYALELALLGVDEAGIRDLRQAMLSCTVENRDKDLKQLNGRASAARKAFDGQMLLQRILAYLEDRKEKKKLNNDGIPRMVKNYFLEMALVLFECARVLRPGAPMVMVNDNVRYAGIVIPVDLILSDLAAQAGFGIEKIWVLPRGKGNSSQQMGKHGREEVRKCVYLWRRL